MQISQGVKAASPAVGVGAGYLSGNLWIGLAAGIVAYLASGFIAKEYAQTKSKEWRFKWMRVFSNCTQEQLDMFSQVLAQRHPLVYHSLANLGTCGQEGISELGAPARQAPQCYSTTSQAAAPETRSVHPVREDTKVADSIEDKVIEIVAEQMSVDKSEITRETSFVNDLNADSLDTVELVMEFEDEFELSIPDEEAEKIQTVGQAIDYIVEHTNKA